jgi:magnesium-transporting ATPase (P-type)
MTMVKMWAGGKSYNVSGKGFDPEDGTITKSEEDGGGDAKLEPCVRSTLFGALLCSSCTLQQEVNDEGQRVWSPQGNSSEKPIVVAAAKINMWANNIYKEYSRDLEIPFSSSRKMMLSLVNLKGEKTLGAGGVPLPQSSNFVCCVKGAPNYILDACSHWITHEQKVEPVTSEVKDQIYKVVDDLSSQALRVLAVAVCPMSSAPFDIQDEDMSVEEKFMMLRKDLQLVGLVASIDPDRDGVRESVLKARGASIRVVMITGDYLKTAVAIGHNVNILQDGDDDSVAAVDCGSLRPKGEYLEDAEMDQMTARVKVFARAKPEDKLEIVKSLQRQNKVCAMTGDGVNDAPALKQADIGVAMGIQGTEVAKGAADMILRDDNFCSIVTAVEKGRVIYAGIQKFVIFIMSVHLAEVLQIFICITANVPVMRTPLQILFLILVTDLPPSIALGMEPGERGILEHRPRPKEQPIVLRWMWQSIVMNGMILSAVIFGVYLFALHVYVGEFFQDDMIADELETPYKENLEKARTVAFISLVLSENVRAYTSRSFDKPVWTDLWKNKQMQVAIVMAQMALLLAVFLPGLTTVLGLAGLEIGAEGWGIAFAGPILTLILCEMYKVVVASQIRRFNDQVRMLQEAEEAARDSDQHLDAIIKQGSGLPKLLDRTNSAGSLKQASGIHGTTQGETETAC